jgi:pimeloyl-ACP methyl ester carboxylesterase
MRAIERTLADAGYLTWNEGYPSRSATIEVVAERWVGAAIDACLTRGAERVHFVTHSLGGILVRQYVATRSVPQLGRVVMLSPPNGGSEVAERLLGLSLYKWIMGPAALQLGTGATSVPRRLGPVTGEFAVITGSSSLDPWFAGWIEGPNDGKVSVASARLDGMRDFLVVSRSHAFITHDRQVRAQVLSFISSGRFTKQPAGDDQSR